MGGPSKLLESFQETLLEIKDLGLPQKDVEILEAQLKAYLNLQKNKTLLKFATCLAKENAI